MREEFYAAYDTTDGDVEDCDTDYRTHITSHTISGHLISWRKLILEFLNISIVIAVPWCKDVIETKLDLRSDNINQPRIFQEVINLV